jgi:hypothetical protein
MACSGWPMAFGKGVRSAKIEGSHMTSNITFSGIGRMGLNMASNAAHIEFPLPL